MQTQCPKCETRFRITDAQLYAAEGHVRCSICDEVFNARSNDDIADDIPDDITNNDDADSASDSPIDNNEIKESADNLSKDNLDEIDEDISLSEMNKLDITKADDEQPDNKHFDNADQQEAEPQPDKSIELDSETSFESQLESQFETQSTSNNQVAESNVEDEVEVDDQSQDKLEQYDNPVEQDANKIDDYDEGELNIAGTDEDGLDEGSIDADNLDIDNLPQDNEDDENDVYLDETGDETIDEDDTVKAADISTGNETSGDQEQLFDLFDEDANPSESHLIPEELRNEPAANEASFTTKALLASGILLLTITLLLEYLWFNRDRFAESAEAQKFIEKTCLQLDCSKLTVRNPSNIELLTRNVYSHPNEKNALMINIALHNNAKFAQPYPVLQISFSDVRGNTIAARRFTPAEYFNTSQEKLPLLHSNAESSINLEIEDPGKQAITYEFNFL